MAKAKKGLIYNLEQVLAQLLKTNQKLDQTTKALDKRLAQLENILIGAPSPARKTRKVRRKKTGRKARKVKKVAKKPRAKKPKKTCTVPGCNRPHYAKGLCAAHYQKMRREKKKEATQPA